ncbi:uncharacterized protein LOC124894026, partial [Capsicum annuum]|uniref:uncharacterized protein LOC124894026 n=1 Tax=Capsicum annuum TaxID=4072 RepID=UPI001FB1799D
MTRERGIGRESIGRAGKSVARTNMPVRTANMPTIPTSTVAPQIISGVGAPTSNHGSTSPTTPNQTNPTTVGTSSQTNQVGEDISRSNTNRESNSSRSHVRTLVTITSVGLQPSKACSNRIHELFKSELDHNGVNWKGVSCDIKDGYFGEFKAAEMDRDPTPKSVIDQIEAYYQAAGGEKKRRVFDLGSEAKGYYVQTLCISCGNTSSSASHES